MNDHLERLSAALADRYTIERELGRGGMATVYLAEDLKHERKVAIKVMRPELAASIGAERFLREIKIAAKLNHPHILGVFDSGRTGGRADGLTGDFLYYVMPFVEGESLRERLDRERQLPIDDALKVTSEVASALSYAHAQGVIHRDIKPENIMLSAGGAVVADFGIARAVSVAGGEQLTETGMAVGTPAYMSPEQATADRVDARSDVYSLGTVLYEMLGGDPPFTGTTPQAILARKMSDTAPSLRPLRDTVSDGLEHVVLRSLARSPADRFATADLFVEALAAAQRGETAPTVVVKRSAKPSKLLAAVATVVVLAVVTTVAVVLLRAGPGGGVTLDPNRVAVAVFRNVTGDRSLDYIGERVGHWITQGVQQAAIPVALWDNALESWDYVQAEVEANRERDPIRAFAERTGAGTVVSGAVYLVGDSLEVQVNLTDVPLGISLSHVEPVRGSRFSESQVINATQERVRGALAIRYGQGQVMPDLAGVIGEPPSLEAYLAFTEGVGFLRTRDFEGIVREMERAAGLDSTWAYPLIRAAVVYVTLGRRSLSDSVLRIAEAFGNRLTPYERAAVEAARAELDGDGERRLIALRTAAELAPTSPDAMNRAIQARVMNRPHEAVAAFEALISHSAWAAEYSVPWAQLSIPLYMIGEHERSLEAAKRAFELDSQGGYFGPAFVLDFQVAPLAALGRVDELVERLDEMDSAHDIGTTRGALVKSLDVLDAYGYNGEARSILEWATAWFDARTPEEASQPLQRYHHAVVLIHAGQLEVAQQLLDGLTVEVPDQYAFRVARALAAVLRGDTAQALADAEWFESLKGPEALGGGVFWSRAILAAALGDLETAMAYFREGDVRPSRLEWPSIWYAPLRGYPPFEELVAPKG